MSCYNPSLAIDFTTSKISVYVASSIVQICFVTNLGAKPKKIMKHFLLSHHLTNHQMLTNAQLLHHLVRSKPNSLPIEGHHSNLLDGKYTKNQLLRLYHEIHILLCLLDDLFKCQILDIETMLES